MWIQGSGTERSLNFFTFSLELSACCLSSAQEAKTYKQTWKRTIYLKGQTEPTCNGKSKPIQTKSHKEAYIYTLTKREKGRKKNIYI